jgi:hypothetical protein
MFPAKTVEEALKGNKLNVARLKKNEAVSEIGGWSGGLVWNLNLTMFLPPPLRNKECQTEIG